MPEKKSENKILSMLERAGVIREKAEPETPTRNTGSSRQTSPVEPDVKPIFNAPRTNVNVTSATRQPASGISTPAFQSSTPIRTVSIEPEIKTVIREDPVVEEVIDIPSYDSQAFATETSPPIEDVPIVETPLVETPVVEMPIIVETPVVETPVIVETPVVEAPVIVETPVVEATVVETPVVPAPVPVVPPQPTLSTEHMAPPLSEASRFRTEYVPTLEQEREPQPENYTDRFLNTEDLYSALALNSKKTDSIYLIEDYLNTIPDSLPNSSRREIVNKLLAASEFDYDLLMGDGVLRVKMLKEYAERFAQHTDDYIARLQTEVDELNQQIVRAQQLMENRKELHKKQFFSIEAEAQRLKEILTFISG